MSGVSGACAFQLDKLTQITGGDPVMIREMLGLFLRLAPDSVSRMNGHLAIQDWRALAREAHKFKPSTMYMGLSSVYGYLELVEETARGNPDADLLSRLLKDIDAECAAAFPQLQLLLQGLA